MESVEWRDILSWVPQGPRAVKEPECQGPVPSDGPLCSGRGEGPCCVEPTDIKPN